MSQLITRFFTATIGASILIGSAWLGPSYFGGVVLLIALLGQIELYQLYNRCGVKAWRITGLLIGSGLALRAIVPNIFLLTAVPVVGLVLWCTFTKSHQPLMRLGATLAGAVYPTALLAFLTDLRSISGYTGEEALALTITVLVLVWASDIFAFFAGSFFGNRPLAPSISPGKTWEGFLGGVGGALLASVILSFMVDMPLAMTHLLILAIVCTLSGAVGDLAESRFKRFAGVKDSGVILPGHGGILDRFDGIIVAAPLAYMYIIFIASRF
ncbi:MAG: phosphatidate cytidylyltransferase [Bacteroidetes bacterium]|nr:phosphatidate cytidylyltransferase [Bacteroidota bacterium]MCY4223817.1 phosphatidate cytidylyltransferase [Bacteroidota bacterium]